VVTADFNGDGFPDLAVANFGSNSVTVLRNDGLWGPAPRPAGHSHGELAALVAALPDIGWTRSLAPLSLPPTPTEASLLRPVLGNPQGSVGLPTWTRATTLPLGRSDGASQLAGRIDLLFAGWDGGWLPDALVADPNLAWMV
jgi:hypothetical protein